MIAMWMNGPWEWIIILVVVLIFFGAGKLPAVLGQMGKGVRAFKDGMTDDEKQKSLEAQADTKETTTAYADAEEVQR